LVLEHFQPSGGLRRVVKISRSGGADRLRREAFTAGVLKFLQEKLKKTQETVQFPQAAPQVIP